MALSAEGGSPKQTDAVPLADALVLAERQRSAGRLAEAQAQCRRILDAWPDEPNALHLLGLIAYQSGKIDEALEYLRRTVELAPDVALYHANLGEMCRLAAHPDEAVIHGRRALMLRPDYPEAHNNLGIAFHDLREDDQAAACHRRALALRPDFPEALSNLGVALYGLRKFEEAAECHRRAIGLAPGVALAHNNLGIACYALKRFDEAVPAFRQAVALNPGFTEAWSNLGNLLMELGSFDEAAAAFDRLRRLDPSFPYALGNLVHCRQQICSWGGLGPLLVELENGVRSGKPVAYPSALLSTPSSPADQLQCARNYVANQPSFPRLWRGERSSHDRIRIAYLSSDFRPHSVGVLAAGLFEEHDKSRFEITAISFGPNDESGLLDRIRNAFEHFVDAQSKSDQEVAELIRDLEIDIAVDLNGHIAGARPNVLSRKPAPIQVNYLGYPGTMGSGHIDYILADPTIIPEDQFDFYSERVVWLPDSFLVTDRRLRISERTPTRVECGLPETAFVFCCFNNAYKIAPEMFDIWMRLLRANDGSVLWLIENSTASTNLRREAEKRGIASERLIFSPKVPLGDHLARQRQADLFLDTLPYNAGTMAAMALWAGLPVLTCPGSTFVSRMAASVLKAAGLPELVAASLQDYEELALRLARNPSLLASLKTRLARNRELYPLFDTKRSTRHIEMAYTKMWARQRRGEPPTSFALDPSP